MICFLYFLHLIKENKKHSIRFDPLAINIICELWNSSRYIPSNKSNKSQ